MKAMLEVYETHLAPAVPMDLLQVASAQFAGWEERPDREEILNRGIVEEAPECIYEMQVGDVERLAVELGDMQWYISERARLAGLSMNDICGSGIATLEVFQRQAVEEPDISPIWISEDVALDSRAEPAAALSLLALRVADAETMTEERLWRGHPEGIPMERLLRDLYSHVAYIADSYGFTLSNLLERNIEKLSARQRAAHVLDDEQGASIQEDVSDPEVAERLARQAYADKVARQREALAVAMEHLFVIDDGTLEQEWAA